MKKIRFRQILVLQLVVIIYTFSSIIAKMASGTEPFSLQFILFYGADVAVLGIYALLWQQMIKRFPLSVAYANRSMALCWSLLWSILIFGNEVMPQNLAGILLVIAGTWIVNSDDSGKEKKEKV